MRQSRANRSEMLMGIGRLLAVGSLAAVLGAPPALVAQVLAPPPASTPGSRTTPDAAPAEGPARPVADLTTRYRFIERYSPNGDSTRPEAVGQTRVAVRETIKIETDKPKGAPDRTQIVVQTIYTERPAELGGGGSTAVTATVRRYDAFRLNPDPPGTKPSDPRPLEGMTVWYQPRSGENPLVINLSEGRGLRENEYSLICRQVFVPDLSGVLPTLPSRIGDRWRIPRAAARALMGERPQSGELPMATLKDLRPEAKGPNLVAIIAVTGQATLPGGPSALNAELQFSFAPPAAAGDTYGGGTLDAKGAITELRASQVTTAGLPGSNGRLRQTHSRELILARQRDNNPGLTIPSPKPTPTEANSWLTFVNPKRWYHFRHPQTLLPDPLAGGESIELLRPHPKGPDVVGVQMQLKTGDAEKDRNNLDPEFHRKMLDEVWRQNHEEVLRGPARYLPDDEWKPLGMRVFRIDAALVVPASAPGAQGGGRVNFDYYLIQTGRPESFVVTARTLQDPPTDFRKETEGIIKTLRIGPPEAGR